MARVIMSGQKNVLYAIVINAMIDEGAHLQPRNSEGKLWLERG